MVMVITTTLLKSEFILAEHECSTNWGDYEPNKSNQIIKSNESNISNQIKLNVGFWGEGKTGVPGEKPLGAE